MSKKAALEKELDWLRTIITLIAAAIFGIFSWIAHNHNEAKQFEMVVASLMLLSFVIAAFLINSHHKKKVRELEMEEQE